MFNSGPMLAGQSSHGQYPVHSRYTENFNCSRSTGTTHQSDAVVIILIHFCDRIRLQFIFIILFFLKMKGAHLIIWFSVCRMARSGGAMTGWTGRHSPPQPTHPMRQTHPAQTLLLPAWEIRRWRTGLQPRAPPGPLLRQPPSAHREGRWAAAAAAPLRRQRSVLARRGLLGTVLAWMGLISPLRKSPELHWLDRRWRRALRLDWGYGPGSETLLQRGRQIRITRNGNKGSPEKQKQKKKEENRTRKETAVLWSFAMVWSLMGRGFLWPFSLPIPQIL